MASELVFDPELFAPTLTEAQFNRVRKVVYDLCGINLVPGKEGLVKTRLSKRLRSLGVRNFQDYLDHVEKDPAELGLMIDHLTTNKTSFFRECHHFTYLQSQVLPTLRQRGEPLRFWSAGCSSGEEPYSIAIFLCEELRDLTRWDVKILATDISGRMLAKAREALYEEDVVGEVPPSLRAHYFSTLPVNDNRLYRLKNEPRSLVRFARLNLMDAWPMKGPFDVIFCRNVMIYFDRATQERLVGRFWDLMRPGGYLMVGHSESLTTFPHKFTYRQPAIYVKQV